MEITKAVEVEEGDLLTVPWFDETFECTEADSDADTSWRAPGGHTADYIKAELQYLLDKGIVTIDRKYEAEEIDEELSIQLRKRAGYHLLLLPKCWHDRLSKYEGMSIRFVGTLIVEGDS